MLIWEGFSYNNIDGNFYASIYGGHLIKFDNNTFSSYTILHSNIMQNLQGVVALSSDGSKFYDFSYGNLEVHDLASGALLIQLI